MNTFQIVKKRGLLGNGRRYRIMETQYEFNPEIWGIIKEFMIDWEVFLTMEQCLLPRSFIIGKNLYPVKRGTKIEKDLVKVSNYNDLVLKFKTEEEAEQEDEDSLGVEAYYLRGFNMFLIDFNVNDETCVPMYLPDYGGSSPLAYAVGGITDNDEPQIKKMRRARLYEFIWKPLRTQFIKKYEEAEQEHLKQEQEQEQEREKLKKRKEERDQVKRDYDDYNPQADELFLSLRK